ncbi:MAG: ParB/RepB/Spo0J family partition protein [Chloroflexi bacterium]|nr:ParB/RepB/Spo0J family partition protein [Chloroflexota bacterium]
MSEATRLLFVNPRALKVDPQNVRRDDEDIDGLAASIREYGVLQPLGITRENGHYRLVFGHRRRDASIRAGLEEVPCMELAGSDDDLLVRQLIENVQRRELNDLEKAEGLARLRRRLGIAEPAASESALDERTAKVVGLSVRTVKRYLGLRDLPPTVRDLIADGALTVTQAQHLKVVPERDKQEELAQIAAEKGLSAFQIGHAATALSREPNLDVPTAVEQAQRGEELPLARVEKQKVERVKRERVADGDEDSDADLWLEDKGGDDADDLGLGSATADGNRVYRIHSIDSFCDEVARIAQCIQEGDLERAVGKDKASATKLKLVRRQLDFAAGALGAIMVKRGWADDWD